MEINQKKRITKYSNGINLKTATDNDLAEYIKTKIHLYIRHNFIDFLLQIAFQKDFKDFTLKLFKQIQSETRIGIHNYLVKRGVYITKHSNKYLLGRVLIDVLLEEEPYKQIDKEIN